MFAVLPEAFPKLQAQVRAMDAVPVTKPPPMAAIGRRLRNAYDRARTDGYLSVGTSELRKLPYAYWLQSEPPLHEVHLPLVQRYWSEALPSAIRSGPRRAKRWLMPLFFAYCENFAPKNEWFQDFAGRLAWHVERSEGEIAKRLQGLQHEVAFFAPAMVPQQLGSALITQAARLDQAMESRLLWPKFVDTPLGTAVLGTALQIQPEKLRDWPIVARLLDWVGRLEAPVSKTAHRIPFANALLTPWIRHRPPDTFKARLVEFFVKTYGDPRITGNRQYGWRDVSPQALSVILTWLAGDTLRGFMRVLEQTADDIWRFRQKFWMAYYNAGHIQEAWLALGSQAAWFAKRLQADAQGMGYGRLESGAAPNQSVLLLKIGQLVFTEWSHNGSLRAYLEDDSDAPTLYESSYHGSELRDALSMDFHDRMNQNPELRHMNSTGGTWQRKARDFIRIHTGIHLGDSEVL
jgi:hypothetical protein